MFKILSAFRVEFCTWWLIVGFAVACARQVLKTWNLLKSWSVFEFLLPNCTRPRAFRYFTKFCRLTVLERIKSPARKATPSFLKAKEIELFGKVKYHGNYVCFLKCFPFLSSFSSTYSGKWGSVWRSGWLKINCMRVLKICSHSPNWIALVALLTKPSVMPAWIAGSQRQNPFYEFYEIRLSVE